MNADHPAASANANARPQPFNLWMTTCHPESANDCAGDVVRMAVEFTERIVLIDLHEVTLIDSSGALFIEAMERFAAYGRHLILIELHEDVRRVLERAKLDRDFHMCSTREEARTKHGRLCAA